MHAANLVVFVVGSLALTLTPGPAVLYIATRQSPRPRGRDGLGVTTALGGPHAQPAQP